MRSATSPALAVRSTRTWLTPGFLGLTSPGSPASHVPVNLHAHSPSLSLPTLAEVEARRVRTQPEWNVTVAPDAFATASGRFCVNPSIRHGFETALARMDVSLEAFPPGGLSPVLALDRFIPLRGARHRALAGASSRPARQRRSPTRPVERVRTLLPAL